MPNTVDTKVVEMQFKNDDFEKNVAKSQETLKNLKKDLEFKDTGKSAEEAFKRVNASINSTDFTKLANGIDAINSKLSTVGVATATAVSNLTNEVGSKVKGFYNKTLGQIISGGSARALKLATGKFKLKGVLSDAKEIENVSDAIGASVKGTAYGLDAAYAAGSQMVASGLRNTEKLTQALTGAAGVAAMTSTSFEWVGGLFAQVQAAGAVSNDVLTRLTEQGLPAKDVLAEALGTTSDKVFDMAKDKEISAEKFFDVMYAKYGEFAKKANDTYTGALSNMNAALSRIGADFFSPYYENMRQAINATTTFIDTFKSFITELGVYKFLEKVMVDLRKQYVERMTEFTNMFMRTDEKMGRVFTKTGKMLVNGINTIVKGVSHVLEMIGNVPKLGYNIKSSFDNLGVKQVVKGFKELSTYLGKNHRVAISIRRVFGLVFATLKTGLNILSGVIGLFASLANTIGRVVGPILESVIILIGALGRFLASTERKIVNFFSAIDLSPFADLGKDIQEFAKPLQELPKTLYHNVGAFLKWWSSLNRIQKLEPVKTVIESINGAIRTFVDTIRTIRDAGGNFLSEIFGNAPQILQPVIDFFTNLGVKIDEIKSGQHLEFLSDLSAGIQDMANKFSEFGESVTQTINENVEPFKERFDKIFENIRNVIQNFITLVSGGVDNLKQVDWSAPFKTFASFGEFLGALASGAFGTASKAVLDILAKLTEGINGFITGVTDAQNKVKEALSPVGDTVKETGDGLIGGISSFLSKLSPVGVAYADTLEPVAENTKTFGDTISEVFVNLKTFFSGIGETIGTVFKAITDNIDWTDVLITINTLSTALMSWDLHKISKGLGEGLPEIFKSIESFFDNLVKVPKSVSDLFDSLKESLTGFQNQLQPNKLLAIGGSLLMIAGALVVLSRIPMDDLGRSLGVLGVTFGTMMGSIVGLAKIAASDKFNIVALEKLGIVIVSMAASMYVIARALERIAKMDEESLKRSVTAIVVLMGSLTLLASQLAKVDEKALTGMSIMMLSLGVTILIIAKAVEKFAQIPTGDLTKGMAAMTGVMIAIGAFVAMLTHLDSVFSLLTSNPFSNKMQPYGQAIDQMKVNLIEVAGAILIIAVAMRIMASALKAFDNIQDLGKSLAGFVATLAAVTASLGVLQGITKISSGSASGYLAIAGAIAIVAVAMHMMATAVMLFGVIDTGTLVQGLAGFAITLTAVSVALGILGGVVGGQSVLMAAAGILVLATAMGMLIPIITVFGALSWDALLNNLLKFSAALLVICGLAVLIGTFAGAIAGAGAAIAIFGGSIVLLGVGLLAVSAGLMGIAAAGIGAAAAIQMIVLAIGNALPSLATNLALALTSFIVTIGKMAPQIGEALKNILVESVRAVVGAATEIYEILRPVFEGIFQLIAEYAPQAGQALLDLLIGGLEALSANMDRLITALVDVVTSLLTSLVDHIPDFFQALSDFVTGIFDKIGEIVDDIDLDDIIKSFTDAFTKIFDAIAKGVEGIINSVSDVFGNIANVIWALKDLIVVLGDQGFTTAVSNAASLVAIGGSITNFANKVAGKEDIISKTGWGVKDLITALMDMKSLDTNLGGAFKAISTGLKQLTANTDKLADGADEIKYFTDTLGGGVVDTVNAAKDAFNNFASSVATLSHNLWDMNNNTKDLSESLGSVNSAIAPLNGNGEIDTSSYTTAFNTISSDARQAASDMTTQGNAIGDNLASGMRDKEGLVYDAGAGLSSNAKSGLESNNSGFYGLGNDAGQGYVNGVNAKKHQAYLAGYALGEQAKRGTKDAQDSNSPAKEFAKLGRYAGLGYINGIGEYEKASSRAGGSLAKNAMSALADSMSAIQYAFNSNLDYSPTITPVVDLSDVDAGSRHISGMFSTLMTGIGGQSTLTAKNAQIVNANLTARLQNGTTNSDVVAALNNLRNDIINRPQVVNNNSVNGLTYDDGSNIASAIGAIVNGVEMQTRAGVR